LAPKKPAVHGRFFGLIVSPAQDVPGVLNRTALSEWLKTPSDPQSCGF